MIKNYRGITLFTIAIKVYDAWLLNHIWPEVEIILRKNQKSFKKLLIHNFSNSDFSLNHQKSIWKTSWGNTLVCRFFQGIWFHTQRKDGANTSSIWSAQRNCYSYNDGYKNMKAMVCSSDGCTDFFSIVTGVL